MSVTALDYASHWRFHIDFLYAWRRRFIWCKIMTDELSTTKQSCKGHYIDFQTSLDIKLIYQDIYIYCIPFKSISFSPLF